MYLVLGAPDPVALAVVDRLLAQEARVCVVGGAEVRARVPNSVLLFEGDAASIDFGLSGPKFRKLLDLCDQVILADTTYVSSADVERNRFVRQAAEVSEFVKAGGAPSGIRFLSSLLIFGSAKGHVSEDEFEVGQIFRDQLEESLAVAEKIVRALRPHRPVSILRTAPVAGERTTGVLSPGSPLSHLARQLKAASEDSAYSFSDLPVYFETVERAAEALFRLLPESHMPLAHLVDENPPTDRLVVEWLARAAGKRVHDTQKGARPFAAWARAGYPGSRSLMGWGLEFGRTRGQELFGDLLDCDYESVLAGLFPQELGQDV